MNYACDEVTAKRPTRLLFRREQRLTHAKQYETVYAAKCSVNRGSVRIFASLNGSEPAITRLGLSVGRRVGGAVVRNRFKRMMREAFRLNQGKLPAGMDLVISAQPHAERTLEEYGDALVSAALLLHKRLCERVEKEQSGTAGKGAVDVQ